MIINIYYTGKNGSARAFMEEMISSGIVPESVLPAPVVNPDR